MAQPLKLKNRSDSFLAVRLAELRRSRNLTLDDLSFRTGSSRSYLWQLENCYANPSLSRISKIALVLGVPPEYFLKESCVLEDNAAERGLISKFNLLSPFLQESIVVLIDAWIKVENTSPVNHCNDFPTIPKKSSEFDFLDDGRNAFRDDDDIEKMLDYLDEGSYTKRYEDNVNDI